MGLHAGLYTQHMSSRNLTHNENVSASDELSLFRKELLKDLSSKATCPQCREKLSRNGSLSEWLGEREEAP
jgi:hypothetical protein